MLRQAEGQTAGPVDAMCLTCPKNLCQTFHGPVWLRVVTRDETRPNRTFCTAAVTMVGQTLLFSLPLSYFDDLQCISASAHPPAVDGTAAVPSISDDATAVETAAAGGYAAAWNESGATCIACDIGINSQGFSCLAEQREHFKTDWHRYNLKRRLDKKPPLFEQEFNKLIEAGDDVLSISGSDTDSSDADSDGDNRDHLAARRTSHEHLSASLQGAQAVFQTAEGSACAVWRCLLLPDNSKHRTEDPSPQQLLQTLRQIRHKADNSSSSSSDGGCLWVLFMLRGGHFAAVVAHMNCCSSSSSNRQPVPADNQAAGPSIKQQRQQQAGTVAPLEVVAHKTFHRYVVRAKAGGKQSTKDATGKYARSAGSRLRRYNEAALQRDMAQLLKDWAPYLSAADLIFLAAPGSNNKVLFAAAADAAAGGSSVSNNNSNSSGSSQQGSGVLNQADTRVRRVPFVTQRPTYSEAKRVLAMLGSVREVPLAPLAEVQQKAAEPSTSQQQSDKEQQQHSQQQQAAQSQKQQQKEAAVLPNGDSPAAPSKKQEEPPLIRASKAGDAARVARLLASGHDPCVKDAKGRSPYRAAANKEVRDAFRRFMAQEPNAWDYSSSDIPSPLTDELEEAQQSRKAEKRARQKAREKEKQEGRAGTADSKPGSSSAAATNDSFDAELAAAMAEAAAISSRASAVGRSKQVGGGAGSSRKGPAAATKPSAEEVAKRREQLAAAAELRLKALQQKQQLW
eukprot:GHRR01003363.1.p1 GENE.GHRR01003363.1~~GHRR01003363.1.p1  ORF type:complete len:736 (+),score=308.17 GHRR01003363.1:278-2485(+)